MSHVFYSLLLTVAAYGGAAWAYHSPPINMTVYRVTPANDTGVIADRDTGDDAGDVFFTMYEAILPIYCPENPRDSICDNYVLDNEQHNVYRQVVVEVDPVSTSRIRVALSSYLEIPELRRIQWLQSAA